MEAVADAVWCAFRLATNKEALAEVAVYAVDDEGAKVIGEVTATASGDVEVDDAEVNIGGGVDVVE